MKHVTDVAGAYLDDEGGCGKYRYSKSDEEEPEGEVAIHITVPTPVTAVWFCATGPNAGSIGV